MPPRLARQRRAHIRPIPARWRKQRPHRAPLARVPRAAALQRRAGHHHLGIPVAKQHEFADPLRHRDRGRAHVRLEAGT